MTTVSKIRAHAQAEIRTGPGRIFPNELAELDKTAEMYRLERKFGHDIRELLTVRTRGADVGRRLGISESTVSRWRARLGIIIKHNPGRYVRVGRDGRH